MNKLKTFIIENLKNDTKYKKQFRTTQDCRDWIINTLDLSLNWGYQELIPRVDDYIEIIEQSLNSPINDSGYNLAFLQGGLYYLNKLKNNERI